MKRSIDCVIAAAKAERAADIRRFGKVLFSRDWLPAREWVLAAAVLVAFAIVA